MEQTLYNQLLNAALIIIHREKLRKKVTKCENEILKEKLSLEDLRRSIKSKPNGYSTRKTLGIVLIIVSVLAIDISGMLAFTYSLFIPAILVLIGIVAVFITAISMLMAAKKMRIQHECSARSKYENAISQTDGKIEKITEEIEKIKKEEEDFLKSYASFTNLSSYKLIAPIKVSVRRFFTTSSIYPIASTV